jgi:citrate lyase beta subunit
MLVKSRNLNVDCAVYDLEDSVALDQKANARRSVSAFLKQERPVGVREVAVRVNSVESCATSLFYRLNESN